MTNPLVIALLIANSVSLAVSYDNDGWHPDRNAWQRLEPLSTSTTPRNLPNLIKDKRDVGVEATVDIQVNGWEATATVEFYPESTMSTTAFSAATTSSVDADPDSPTPVPTTLGSTEPSWKASTTTFPATITETSGVSPANPTKTETVTTTNTSISESTVEESGAASTYGPTGTTVAAAESIPSISSQDSVSVVTVTVTDTVTTGSPTSPGSPMISSPAFVNMTSCRNKTPTGNWTSPWANFTGLTAWPCTNWTAPPFPSGISNTTLASGAGTIYSASSMVVVPSSTVGLQSLQLSRADHCHATIASSLVLCIAIMAFHFM